VFDEVEHKPNFDLWLSRVGFPVYGYRPKTPHSCKDTKMATPLDFCRGMSRPVNWYRLMLRHMIRHVANMWVCEQAMWARLSDGSFFDFFPFSRRTLHYYVTALRVRFWRISNASTVAFIKIWGNCPCLLTRLSFGMTTVGTATFWLHLLISSSLDR